MGKTPPGATAFYEIERRNKDIKDYCVLTEFYACGIFRKLLYKLPAERLKMSISVAMKEVSTN